MRRKRAQGAQHKSSKAELRDPSSHRPHLDRACDPRARSSEATPDAVATVRVLGACPAKSRAERALAGAWRMSTKGGQTCDNWIVHVASNARRGNHASKRQGAR